MVSLINFLFVQKKKKKSDNLILQSQQIIQQLK